MSDPMMNSLYSPYGAYEMKSKYQRNFFFGTLATLSFVVLILIISWIVSNVGKEDYVDAPMVVIKTIAELGPPPTIAKKPPQVKVNQPNVVAPKVGIPKPVADDEVLDDDVQLATRDELAQIVAPDLDDISNMDGDDISIEIEDDDYLPAVDEFVPSRKNPNTRGWPNRSVSRVSFGLEHSSARKARSLMPLSVKPPERLRSTMRL